jgi:glycosyltransferase involved in cell wall biosynthesis
MSIWRDRQYRNENFVGNEVAEAETMQQNSTNPTPVVSIGIPVYNGEKYLRQALDSMLCQTFRDFEIVITDNSSTDRTEQICREYSAKDARVKYHRNDRNIGPSANYNLCFELSKGKYFKWAAHDDMIQPTYLERCVAVLDSDPTVVNAYTRVTVIDEQGDTLHHYNFRPETDAASPSHRFGALVCVNNRFHRATEIFGLYRSDALRQTPLQGCYARGDSVLLVRLALLGRFYEIPEYLFLSRHHAAQSMQTMPSEMKTTRARLREVLGSGPLPPPEWWDPRLKGRIVFPEWNVLAEYFASIGMAPLSPWERIKCYGIMAFCTVMYVPKLLRDLIFAGEKLTTRVMTSPDMPAESWSARRA